MNKISLRKIVYKDIELLRQWKNKNRKSFFYKKIITKRAQKIWFKEYLTRIHDYMFMIEYKKETVGCIGFRLLSDSIDLYNLMLISSWQKRGFMRSSLKLIVRKIQNYYKNLPIKSKVLKTNKALNWYLKNNFVIELEFPEYYSLFYKGDS